MAITRMPEIPGLDEPDTGATIQSSDEGTSYNFRELLDSVIQMTEVIFTVPSDQVHALKTGLTTRKSKDNQKLTNAGLPGDNNVLNFKVYEAKDKDGAVIPDQMCVRVKLAPRKSIQILSMTVPDDQL